MEEQALVELEQLIRDKQSQYVNTDETTFEDPEFDAIVNLYEEKTGEKLNLIGAPVDGDGIPLKYPMPSMDKAKGKTAIKTLKKFISENPGPYMESNKLDGSSLQIIYEEGSISILSGGDGNVGKDCTFLVPYLNLPDLDFDCVIRGELKMKESDFVKLKPHLKSKGNKAGNSRNTVNGVVNGKKHPDDTINEKCIFITFSILSESMNIEDEIEALSEMGFQVPEHRIITQSEINDKLSKMREKSEDEADHADALNAILTEDLKKQNEKTDLSIDGLVLTSIPNSETDKTSPDNPTYSIAFKVDTFVAAIIDRIEWRCNSRYGYCTPVAVFDPPIEFMGSINNYATAHNARFVLENNIGAGAIVTFTKGGDIIPKIVSGVTPGEEVSAPDFECHFDENEVELVLDDLDCRDVHVAKLLHFVNTLKVKHCGESTINKLYDTGITTIEKLLRINQESIQKLERKGEKSAVKIIKEFKDALDRVTFPRIMYASCIFGELIGETVLESFVSAFPMWEVEEITSEDIKAVKGFGPVKSKRIAEALPIFRDWISRNQMCYPKARVSEVAVRDLAGHTIVCTGFTIDEVRKQQFISRGAQVKKSWVVGCTILIAKTISSSNKFKEAAAKGIPIVPMTDIDNITDYL